MKILTCNIRYAGASDGENAWHRRRELCAEAIRDEDADLVCFQEMWAEQFADLHAALPGYAQFAMTDEAAGQNPHNAIFYRADAFEPIAAGGYWLSETPHVPGSRSWDSANIRFANWVRLVDRRAGVEFRILNTHLDHESQAAREQQARLLVEDAAAYPEDYPQFLTGDLNCEAGNAAIYRLERGGWIDTYGGVHGTKDPGPTHHRFLGPAYAGEQGKIDWVFLRGAVRAVGASIVTTSEGTRFPSDHYFVSATVAWR